MASLQDTFQRAWRDQRGLPEGWLVNLEPTRGVELGAVGRVHDGALSYESTLANIGVTGLAVRPDGRTDSPWQCVTNSGIKAGVTAGASTPAVGTALGEVSLTVDLQFGSQAGAAAYGTSMWWHGYSDLGQLRAQMVEAARGGALHKGDVVVVDQQLTGKGVVFLATSKDASLTVGGKAQVAPGGLPSIADLSTSMQIERTTGAAEARSFADGAVLALRVLTLGTRGYFWWRKLAVEGALPVDPDEAEELTLRAVQGEGPDEYFALL